MTEKNTRLISIDAFRGITIAAMILVNNPGSWEYVYPPLRHADWHGWTPTDLIFPFFLFIMGFSIKLSLDKTLKNGIPRAGVIPRILRRTAMLLLLGLFLNGFPEFNPATIRIPGVLQRIGICYFLVSLFYLSRIRMVGERLYFSPKSFLWTGLGLLVLYFCLMQFVHVPGYGAGLWDSKPGNTAAWIDRVLFGHHLWKNTWDPEGVLSTLPALVTTMSGLIAAWWIRLQHQNRMQKLSMLFIGGLLGVLAAGLISIWIPINKQLWTPSFVFLTSGLASVFLGICYWMTEIKKWTSWALPFLVLGSNAILVYFLSSIFGRIVYMIKINGTALGSLYYQSCCVPVFGNMPGSLMFALTGLIVWTLIMGIFYKYRIFFRV